MIWTDEAKAEFYEAERWYAGISHHLSESFVHAVDQAVRSLSDFPRSFPVVYRERRRAGVKRFPYGLFYQIEKERVLLIACLHGKRDPRLWQGR